MSQCCAWRSNLRVEKQLLSEPPEAQGDPIAFGVRWVNDGPDRAVGARIRDVMNLPAALGLTPSTPVVLSYSAGATGPATTTIGALASRAGVGVTRMEAGSYVQAFITGALAANFNGAVLTNRAVIIPPEGHEDPHPFDNEDEVSLIVPPCCTDAPTGYVSNLGGLNSGGLCVGVEGIVTSETTPGSNDYRAVFQGRTQSMAQGSGNTFGGVPGGFYLQELITNPWGVPSLLTIDLVVQPNAFVSEPGVGPVADPPPVTFIHHVGEQLAVSPPDFGGASNPVPLNWCYTTLQLNNPVFDVIPPGTGVAPYYYTPQTNSCRFQRLLQPGESVTIYAQWWAMWGAYAPGHIDPAFQYVLHGGMASISRLDRGVVEL